MALYSGRVVDGKVVVEGASLPEGAEVDVFLIEENEELTLTPDMEDELAAAIERLDRGEGIPWEEVRKQIRKIEQGDGGGHI